MRNDPRLRYATSVAWYTSTVDPQKDLQIIIGLGISVRLELHQEMNTSFVGNMPLLANLPLYPGPCSDLIP
jgi:hypothetical protein